MKYRFKGKPFKHQVMAIKRALKQGYIGLLWQPGTGKTRAIIDWACILHMKEGMKRVLVVCPLSVAGVWEEEVEKYATVKTYVSIFDKRSTSIPVTKTALEFVIVNYDIGWRRKKLFKRYNPELVVSDESQKIKRPSARRSWFLRSFRHAPHRAILTGTPVPKGFIDLFGQWVFLNWRRFGTNFQDFKDRHVVFGGYMHKKIKGYKKVDEIKWKVKQDASVRRKDQCIDLPPEMDQRVPVELEDTARKMYERMAMEFFLQFDSGEIVDAKNAGAKLMKLQQIAGGFLITEEGVRQVSEAKFNILRDFLEVRFEEEQRVVVFCRFRAELDAINQLGVNGFRVPTYQLRGGIKREERDIARRLFQGSPGPSLFVAQIQAGSLGIGLYKSSEAFFYSTSYAYDDWRQAKDRLHRQGQKSKVIYRHLLAKNTVDEDILESLKEKKSFEDIVMGDPEILTRRLAV